ncbi:MAG: hypothetical protein SFT90_03160 [Rickettsiales bacterium]|nr:hypothetical protein [Rickettsiales bacterium]
MLFKLVSFLQNNQSIDFTGIPTSELICDRFRALEKNGHMERERSCF